MNSLPAFYRWLYSENIPPHLQEAITQYGVTEIPGKMHSATIMRWIKSLGRKLGVNVNDDETPWCGTFAAHCIDYAGLPVPSIAVRAMSWLNFGIPKNTAVLGDVLVFNREGGGHVGFYVGQDDLYYHVLGGNQKNMVRIDRLAKYRCAGIRRPAYPAGSYRNLRTVKLAATGEISKNEA